ncbi:hypothetical protein EVAR_79628_1 [Eumeta japonica]|uniref:Uncharacterized protein n=1 Tax=Eumeta variegata TaxID=151549 RepID=A0A4C1UEA0_EUMVA|nr:hypothetical protein EVAR_79628_1 [Eumeta japonica]
MTERDKSRYTEGSVIIRESAVSRAISRNTKLPHGECPSRPPDLLNIKRETPLAGYAECTCLRLARFGGERAALSGLRHVQY